MSFGTKKLKFGFRCSRSFERNKGRLNSLSNTRAYYHFPVHCHCSSHCHVNKGVGGKGVDLVLPYSYLNIPLQRWRFRPVRSTKISPHLPPYNSADVEPISLGQNSWPRPDLYTLDLLRLTPVSKQTNPLSHVFQLSHPTANPNFDTPLTHTV